MAGVLDILTPEIVVGIANEIKTPYDRLQKFFGLEPGGKNCTDSDVRQVFIDIINAKREVGTFRAPGAGPTFVAPLAIGRRSVTAPSHFECMPLDFNILNNIRAIGEGASALDKRGAKYVKEQLTYLKARSSRWREFMVSQAMQGGTLNFNIVGNTWVPTLTAGNVTISWPIAASHKNQLGGIIDAPWTTAGTKILAHLAKIWAMFEADYGMPPRHAWCNSTQWQTILSNTEVQQKGGSSNVAFETWELLSEMIPGAGAVDIGKTEQKCVLKAFPFLTWHVTDRVWDIDGAVTKMFADDTVVFHPEPDQEWMGGIEVKETVNKGYGQEAVDVYGHDTYIKQPVDTYVARLDLLDIDNFIPRVNPNAVAVADTVP